VTVADGTIHLRFKLNSETLSMLYYPQFILLKPETRKNRNESSVVSNLGYSETGNRAATALLRGLFQSSIPA
jgi:hypothetical protein